MVGALEEEELVGLNVQQLEYRSDTPASLVLPKLCSSLSKHYVCKWLMHLFTYGTTKSGFTVMFVAIQLPLPQETLNGSQSHKGPILCTTGA